MIGIECGYKISVSPDIEIRCKEKQWDFEQNS